MINTWLILKCSPLIHASRWTPKLVVTAADSEGRTVLELNAEPCRRRVRPSGGCPGEVAESSSTFALNALAVRIRDQFYVRSIQRVNADHSPDF